MYREAHTSVERLKYRLDKFVEELRKHPLDKYYNRSVADAIDAMILCELEHEEHESNAYEDMREIEEMAKQG